MQIPKIAWTIIASVLVLLGLLNILAASGDREVYEGVRNAPSLIKGVIFFISGVTYFVALIVRKYRNKKSNEKSSTEN